MRARGSDSLRRGTVAMGALLAALAPAAALAQQAVSSATAPPVPDAPRVPVPDRAYFARSVEPLLKEGCAACHRGGRGGALDLTFGYVPGGDDARIDMNFKATLGSVDTDDPARSPLLRKGLPVAAGGLPHAGGVYAEPGGRLDLVLREFLVGATPANRPPILALAPVRSATAGEEVRLDARPSADPEGSPVGFRWELTGRPVGSATLLAGTLTPTPSFTADAPGMYVLRLRAWDGVLEALPLTVNVNVAARGAPDGAMGAGETAPPSIPDLAADPGMAPGDGMMGGGPMSGDGMGGPAMGPGMDTEPFLSSTRSEMGPVDQGPSGGGRPLDTGASPALDTPIEERRFARSLFFGLRGRGPTPGELARALRDRPAALVDRMLAERETWDAWLDAELYYYLLIDRFRPVSDRVLALPALLATGEATVVDATREIVVSAEFNTRNPGNDTFVTVVLEQLLGMVVQDNPRVLAEGKRMFDGYRTRLFNELGANQSDVVRIVLLQRDFHRLFLRRQYRRVLGVSMPPAEEAAAAARLGADPGSYRALLREWLLSDAFRAASLRPRVKDDQVFIRTLFADVLRREPTFEEFRNMRNAFLAMSDPAPVRNVLAQLLVESVGAIRPSAAELAKPRDWVRGQFLDLLGREATERELDVFVSTLGEYGCDPRTLTLALVASPHYQYY